MEEGSCSRVFLQVFMVEKRGLILKYFRKKIQYLCYHAVQLGQLLLQREKEECDRWRLREKCDPGFILAQAADADTTLGVFLSETGSRNSVWDFISLFWELRWFLNKETLSFSSSVLCSVSFLNSRAEYEQLLSQSHIKWRWQIWFNLLCRHL